MARVVTVGGSVAGMATALLLARRGHQVTVLERDGDGVPLDPDDAFSGWERRGVPHLRGTHVFNARGLGVLRERAPDVVGQLVDAGAQEVAVDPAGNPDLVRLDCRRTTFELVIRRAALDEATVRFLPGIEVAELVGSRDGRAPHVTGVRTRGGEAVAADLVVDTSGRRSRLPGWLADLGGPPVDQEVVDSGMAVHTRWYRLRDPDGPSPSQISVNLGYASCFLAPADNGTFSLTFGTFGRDPALGRLRQVDGFEAAVSSLPAVAGWVFPDVARPLEERLRIVGSLPNSVRRFVSEGRPVATGVVALADAAMCTNPRFGRGIALGLVQAAALADLLESAGDPAQLARSFAEVAGRELEPWYHDAVAADRLQARVAERVRAGESPMGVGGPGDDEPFRFAKALPVAVQRDPLVRTAFLRTWHLLQGPSVLAGNADIRNRVALVGDDLERDPPPPPGPGYQEMCRILSG